MPWVAMAEHLKPEEMTGEPTAVGEADTQRLTNTCLLDLATG